MLSGVVGVILLLLVLSGYFETKVATEEVPGLRSVPEGARFAIAEEVTQPRYESAIGAIEPVHEAKVASKILARVLEVNVSAGTRVSAGEVLVQLSALRFSATHRARAEWHGRPARVFNPT